MNIDIPKELGLVLTDVAARLKKREADVVVQALKDYLEDQEDSLDALEAYEEWVRNGKKTISLKDVMKQCGLHESDLES